VSQDSLESTPGLVSQGLTVPGGGISSRSPPICHYFNMFITFILVMLCLAPVLLPVYTVQLLKCCLVFSCFVLVLKLVLELVSIKWLFFVFTFIIV
jgi:hypothetical protein